MRLEGHKEKAAGRPFPEGDVGLGRDTIRHFINTYRNSHKYIVSELPKKMFHEVKTLPFFGCSPYKEHITEVFFLVLLVFNKNICVRHRSSSWDRSHLTLILSII